MKRKPRTRSTPKTKSVHFESEPSISGGKFQDHLIICYGPPKIGKSTLFSHFPGAYFLATEPGYKALNVRKTDLTGSDGVEMWNKFRSVVETARSSPKSIETISMWVIDTATNLSKSCMDWISYENEVKHPSDLEWGKGWAAYADEFTKQILALASTNKGIAFIAHQSTVEVVSRRMRITKEAPDLPSTTYRIVNNMSDVILQMSYVRKSKDEEKLGEARCLYTKPCEVRDAGDRTGRLPDVIHFKTEKEAVRKILSCFDEGGSVETVKRKKVKKKKKKRVS